MTKDRQLNRTATIVLIEVRTGKSAEDYYRTAVAMKQTARAIARELRERYNIPVSHTTVRGHLRQLGIDYRTGCGWVLGAAA